MKRTIFLLLGFLLLSGAYSPSTSQAANLVQNGGFEIGDFTGWTQSGNTGYTSVQSSFPLSGTFSAFFGPLGSDGFISQALATTPGQSYTVSFWLANFVPGTTEEPNGFHLSWGGSEIFSLLNAPNLGGYTQYSFVAQATSSSTTLSMGFRNDLDYFILDDVDVSPVPIPGALVLFGSGLVGLAGISRKWFKK